MGRWWVLFGAPGWIAANAPDESTAISDSANGICGLTAANQILIQKWRGSVELKIWSRNRNNPKPNRDTHAEMKSTSFAMFAMSMLRSPNAF